MNDDLISRSKLLRQLDYDIEITQRFIDKILPKVNNRLELEDQLNTLVSQLNTLQNYRAIVEDMKTVYDVDKVVEQLKEVQFTAELEEYILAETNVTELFETQVVQIDEAIEIVKAGGRDEG